jgi:hypothetical protein
MQPRVREVIDFLSTQHAVLERAIAAVPPARRRQRPFPDRWSTAEVMAHLVVVDERIIALLRDRVATARANGLGPERETSPVVPTVAVGRLLDRSRPVTTTAASHPPADPDPDAAWSRLDELHAAMTGLLESSDGLALSEVVIPNPVLGPLNVYQWFVFAGGHRARHAAQIEEMAAQLAGAPHT